MKENGVMYQPTPARYECAKVERRSRLRHRLSQSADIFLVSRLSLPSLSRE